MFWYEEEIKNLENKRDRLQNKEGLVFFGSSSIRLWKTLESDFNGFNAINMGFGGSTLAACTWFFKRIMTGLQPTGFVIYAGDNDLGDGRHPEEVYICFKQLVTQIREEFGNIPIGFISVKPSFARWHLKDSIRFTNQIIEQEIRLHEDHLFFINVYNHMIDESGLPVGTFFLSEGLHINDSGYALWKTIILEQFEKYGVSVNQPQTDHGTVSLLI